MRGKFAPNPWTFDRESGVVQSVSGEVCEVCDMAGALPDDEPTTEVLREWTEANGRLIESAPRMYDLLNTLITATWTQELYESLRGLAIEELHRIDGEGATP